MPAAPLLNTTPTAQALGCSQLVVTCVLRLAMAGKVSFECCIVPLPCVSGVKLRHMAGRGSYLDFSTESSVKSTLQSNVKGTGPADEAVRELLRALEAKPRNLTLILHSHSNTKWTAL